MNRGDIYWVNLDPTQGSQIKKQRPCVIVSATPINHAGHLSEEDLEALEEGLRQVLCLKSYSQSVRVFVKFLPPARGKEFNLKIMRNDYIRVIR